MLGKLTVSLCYPNCFVTTCIGQNLKIVVTELGTGALVPTTIFDVHLSITNFTYSFDETIKTTSQTLMEKCQDTHEVKIIMIAHLFLSLIVDIVIKVIADS